VRSWHEATDRGFATSRQILRVERTCHGHGRTTESDPKATLTGSTPPALNRAKLLQRSSVLGRRHARGSPERAGEARLRGKPALESNLADSLAARRASS